MVNHKLVSRQFVLAVGLGVVLLALSGCNLLRLAGGEEPTVEETPAADAEDAQPEATALTLAPTLPAGGEGEAASEAAPEESGGDLAPTPLPEPTQITPAASEGGEEGESEKPKIPSPGEIAGISINPQLGEPGDIITVDGSGFAPSEKVTLHWAASGGETGPVYVEVEADSNGNFNVGLIIPPGDQWPGGPPKDLDILQLRARSESLGDFYYWANFRYLERFDPITSLVQTFTNTDYGYAIDLPNAWTWKWEDDETFDVRFTSPSGIGKGFIRIANTTKASEAINAIMPLEAPGETYTTEEIGAGSYPGTQVKASNGLVVWFIPSSVRTYAISFMDDAGNFYEIIAASFRLTD
jgi:hypothetical protein